MPLTVEICVEGVPAALAAGQGGADRIELCSHLAVGGVTPGPGAMAVACRQLNIPVHVLIRPRGGNFVYSASERAEMLADVAYAREIGADGVVFGCLTPENTVDRDLMAELVQAARPLSVTFHKAFDEVADPFAALETLVELGVNRVLTSGRGRPAREDLPLLSALVRAAGGRLIVLPGGSITPADFPALAGVGLHEAHLGSAACVNGQTSVQAVRQIMDQGGRF